LFSFFWYILFFFRVSINSEGGVGDGGVGKNRMHVPTNQQKQPQQ